MHTRNKSTIHKHFFGARRARLRNVVLEAIEIGLMVAAPNFFQLRSHHTERTTATELALHNL